MKAFTSLEQSKKLAEILPIESADMWWREVTYGFYHIEAEIPKGWYSVPPKGIPCWSLAALLEVLPERVYVPYLQKEDGKYHAAYGNYELLCEADNPIDACYEMILELHEQKLL